MPYRVAWAAFLAPALALAQTIPTETRISNLEAAVKSAQSAGDNAWMLVSAVFVIVFNLAADIIYGLLDPRIRIR